MPETEKIRTFVAIDLSDDMRARIEDLVERLSKGVRFAGADPNWVAPANLHLTLKFLGAVEASRVPEIENALRFAGERAAPFTFSARGLGVFPNEYKPRVLWVAAKRGADDIVALNQRVQDAVFRLGFDPEDRPFKPHLTLARMKSNKGARGLVEVVKSHSRFFCGETRVDRFRLMRSELLPEGARYTPLAEIPLLAEPKEEESPEPEEDRKAEPGD